MPTSKLFRKAVIGMVFACAFGAQDAPAQTRIEFASWQLVEKGRAEKFNALIDKFAKEHPKIAVEKVAIPYPVFEQTIFTQAGQGGGPDVFFVADEALPKAVNAGFAAPLGELLRLSTLDLSPMNQLAAAQDKQFALVWEAITYNLIYNKELLAAAGAKVPTTYDEFLDAAKRLKAEGTFGYAFRSAPAEAAGMWYDATDWVYGLGGRWSKAGKPQFDSEPVIKAVTRLAEVYKAGYVPKGVDAATYRRMFWEGKIGMMIDNLAVPTIVIGGNPAMRDKVGIAPVPFESREHTAITSFIVINAHSKHKPEAAELVAYLYSKEGQLAVADMLGGASVVGTNVTPPAEALASAAPWLAEAKKAEVAQTVVSPVPEGLAVKTTELKTVLSDAIEQVLFGGISPADAMRAAQQRALEVAGR
jgi:multiple sugar transport system substrate-binding protein